MSNPAEGYGVSTHPVASRGPSTFQPRIVRGTVGRETNPLHVSTINPLGTPRAAGPVSPTRARRTSSVASAPFPRIHRVTASGSTYAASPTSPAQPTSFPASFPRPAYLNHSSLRTYIHSQPPPPPPANRYRLEGLGFGRRPGSNGPQPYLKHPANPRQQRLGPSPDNSDNEMDGTSRNPRQMSGQSSRSAQMPNTEEEQLKLPTRWNESDRHPLLQVSPDGKDVTFTGSTQADKEAAGVRANNVIPPACGIYYYEVEILSRGTKGHIGIGLGTSKVRLSRLPGWEHESWGYHGDDGNAFSAEGDMQYGPKFTTGDIVGCGVDYSVRRAFYTKNGAFLGLVFSGLPDDLYPLVGLRTSNESVRANFGQHAFLFDIESHIREVRNKTWARIMRTPVEWTVDSSAISLLALPIGTTSEGDTEAQAANAATSSPADPSVPRLPPLPPLSAGLMDVVTSVSGSMSSHSPPPTPLTGKEPLNDIRIPIREIVLEYMVHQGYGRAALAFKQQTDREREEELKSAQEITTLAAVATARANMTAGSSGGGGAGRSGTPRRASMHSRKSSTMDVNMFGVGPGAEPKVENRSPVTSVPPAVGVFAHPRGLGDWGDGTETMVRQRIVEAVLRGDIDYALQATAVHYPDVLRESGGPSTGSSSASSSGTAVVGDGLMKFKLRCRKLVELLLDAAEANQRSKNMLKLSRHLLLREDKEDGMDIDNPDLGLALLEPSSTARSKQKQKQREYADAATGPPTPTSFLEGALLYGRELDADYKADTRLGVQALFKRTLSLMAYENPLDSAEAGEEIAQFAGPQARADLAKEVNRAILESQGRRADSALERLYRQTAGAIVQLGLMGEGQAAFADPEKEFLEV